MLTYVTIEGYKSELLFTYNADRPNDYISSQLYDCPLNRIYVGRAMSYYINEKDISKSPFDSNQSLEEVVIGDIPGEVNKAAFYGCLNLKNVTVGNSVTKICEAVFSACQALEYFSFGPSVTTIEKDAFSDCTSMKSLISYAINPPVCGEQALDDINKWICELTVPYGSVEKYMAASQWKEFFYINAGDEIKISDIVLDFTSTEIAEGDQIQLTATIAPSTASNTALTWTSRDETVATYRKRKRISLGIEGRLCRHYRQCCRR